MRKSKKWSCWVLLITAVLLAAMGGLTAVIDPFFHYHGPLEGLTYPILEQRYQNDGIVKHFDYDAIITGTSMTENFRASELNALADVNAVKVPFSGATYKEINENLKRAIRANPDIKMVVRCLDGYMLFTHKDEMRTDAVYPDYLYDDSLLNDVSYVLNTEVLLQYTVKVLQHTMAGLPTTDFDAYSYWQDDHAFGPEAVLKNYSWSGERKDSTAIRAEEAQRVVENVLQNVVETAEENPDIEFYYYFPPYSILWWHNQYRNGDLVRQVEAYQIASREILKCENIHLFSFSAQYDIITDLTHYKDLEHHSAQINSRILEAMLSGENRLTPENYESHWQEVRDFYTAFDYGAHFARYGYPLTGEE